MNAATKIATRVCINRGHVPLGIHNGFSGLLRGEVDVLGWQDVSQWSCKAGSELGTNRDHPKPDDNSKNIDDFIKDFVPLGEIAYAMQKYGIQSLMVIGGFEAFTALDVLQRARPKYPAFCIPMVHLPATISNNIPGTDFSVGSDTALNVVLSCVTSL